MHCPACNAPLEPHLVDGQILERCGDCGGEYCDHAALRSVLSAHLPPVGARGAGYHRPSPLSDPVRYRRCPACNEPMLRQNFRETSGVVVDVCSAHGIWLDRGELAMLVEFASTGALVEAERRLRERADARKRLDEFAQGLRAVGPRHYLGHLQASSVPMEAIADILRVIPGLDPDDDR